MASLLKATMSAATPPLCLGSIGVKVSCLFWKVDFYVVRSALQISVFLDIFFTDQVFSRSYVLSHIRLRSFAVVHLSPKYS